jgi:hypothetical protein
MVAKDGHEEHVVQARSGQAGGNGNVNSGICLFQEGAEQGDPTRSQVGGVATRDSKEMIFGASSKLMCVDYVEEEQANRIKFLEMDEKATRLKFALIPLND